MRTEFTHQNQGPSSHVYNDPDLSPIEFLQAVMHAEHLPMATRIDAARALLPFTEPRPASVPSSHIGCTIVIGGIPSEDLGPRLPDPDPRSPNHPTGFHSQNPFGANITVPRDGEPGDLQNLTTISEPSPFIEYSRPPTVAELQEIKTVINRLRPDLAHLPIPEPRLCQCGHWLFGPCPLGERCRDRSKLN